MSINDITEKIRKLKEAQAFAAEIAAEIETLQDEIKANPYDNAIMESFYRTLKRELVQDAHYDNPEQARMDIFKYIELYYNTKRIHSALGWLSPTQFESQSL